MSLLADIRRRLNQALDVLEAEGVLPAGLDRSAITVESPRDPSHGDLATNAAMVLAGPSKKPPRALAEPLAARLATLAGIAGAEAAGPGFVNFRLDRELWEKELGRILSEAGDYGRSRLGEGVTVNVEYVSANPTGPMHMGHCRGAVVGDALATLLEYCGHKVIREYYVNDAGAQVDWLARSAHHRYREALGEKIGDVPEGLYPGDYLIEVGAELSRRHGAKFSAAPEGAWLDLFRAETVALMLDRIRADLALLGIEHDLFASESEVRDKGLAAEAEAQLRAAGLVYEGVLERPKSLDQDDEWEPVELTLFRSTQFGDDADRPLKKSDGSWTYFGTDLAYHLQKARAADQLIDIWGADHAGTVKRIRAAVTALTGGKTPFDVKLVQMVRLLRAGEPVKMSKRSGSFVPLGEVIEEVGRDVVRFTMLTRKADAQMDFDFAKVVEASRDNPVFYVHYAHARISSLGRKAKEAGIDPEARADLSLLDEEELALVKLAAQFPRVVEAAARAREPHRIAFFLADLAAAFHALWNRGNDDPQKRILVAQNPSMARARLELANGIGQVVRNGLALMGVEAVEELR